MKDIFYSQNKKYLSSRLASKTADYSSDYIGQLCRSKKLDCIRIGHAWFVCEESLIAHKGSTASKNNNQKISDIVENKNTSSVEQNTVSDYVVVTNFVDQISNSDQVSNSSTVETSVSFANSSNISNGKIGSSLKNNSVEQVSNADDLLSDSNGLGGVKSTGSVVQVIQLNKNRSYLFTGLVGVLSLVFIFSSVILFASKPRIVAIGSSSANAYDAIHSVSVFFRNQYLGIRSVFNRDRYLTLNTVDVPEQYNSDSKGMVVVPSTGESSSDEAMKKRIKDSFSDQVEVKPDASGTGGVITPIFRKAKGADFVYVLVPVNSPDPP